MKPKNISHEAAKKKWKGLVKNASKDESDICIIDMTNGWNACIEAYEQHRALKKAKRVKVSRVDEGNCSMSEIYKLAEQIDRLDKVYANVSVTASKRTDQLVQHIEGVNHVINELKSRFEKCETYNIDAEIKKIHAVVQALYAIGGEDATRLDKLETQIAVIHAGDTDIQKRMLQSIYDINQKIEKL